MRAVVLTSPGSPLDEIEVADPLAPPGGSVVDVLACGICHSDLHAAAGDYPTTLPVILFFLLAQRRVMAGMTAGAVKG